MTIQTQAAQLGITLAEGVGTAVRPEGPSVRHPRGHAFVPHREGVREAADLLASEGWERREEPGELARVEEIRRLVTDQLADDRYDVLAERHGRSDRVAHYDAQPEYIDNGVGLWPATSPDQRALQASIEPIMDAYLTGEQRVVVRWRYSLQYSEQQIAEMLGISRRSVRGRLETIHNVMRAALLTIFGPVEVQDEA